MSDADEVGCAFLLAILWFAVEAAIFIALIVIAIRIAT